MTGLSPERGSLLVRTRTFLTIQRPSSRFLISRTTKILPDRHAQHLYRHLLMYIFEAGLRKNNQANPSQCSSAHCKKRNKRPWSKSNDVNNNTICNSWCDLWIRSVIPIATLVKHVHENSQFTIEPISKTFFEWPGNEAATYKALLSFFNPGS